MTWRPSLVLFRCLQTNTASRSSGHGDDTDPLRIVGDSMYPLLKSGDIVFYKQVHDIMHSIIWGEMYLISFDIDGDEYVSVKYLQKSDIPDHIVLVSYNEHHKPMEIHINRIRALAFIKASLRLNSLK